ncbi:hypothetical protein [Sphingobacterium siyangense]|uniref:Uncharacterized protein n=1 Tax=Sphingobacterium siyangense TaxID=459529 RepID=A0A562MFY3_9SPHI|nr:hypothetical protein [Sphingobacterium siyangense]TWI18809.1 hypothetical protein IQ31_02937 [Sphingobacterium siyangense]
MVAVFKTNVKYQKKAEFVLLVLLAEFPNAKINFDLEDCDKILRIEGTGFSPKEVQRLVQNLNYTCEELE